VTALDDIDRGWRLPADCAPIDFTEHAVEQANARRYRRLEIDQARRALCAHLEDATVSREAPPWTFKQRRRDVRVLAWLVFERERLCLPLYAGRGRMRGALVAGTCLTPNEAPAGAEVRVVIGAHRGHWAGGSS
jgi:hypothetical protein